MIDYAHVNRALPNWDTPNGKIVKNKDHYDRLMKEAGMISYDKAQEMATGPKRKEYKLTDESRALINAAKALADKNGKVKLSGRMIEAMMKKGIVGNKVLPKGFNLPK